MAIDKNKKITVDIKKKDRNIENKFLNGINKKTFFDAVEKENINLANILLNKNRPIREYHKFNLFLRKLNRHGLTIYECIMYMEEEYVKFKKILSMLDAENIFRLKDELSKKFKIKILRTKLKRFIIDDEDFENE